MAEEQIDGTGRGFKAKVNSRNRTSVSAASYSESRMISAQDGQTFIWTTSASADTGEYIVYLQCMSTDLRLIIDKVTVNGVLAGLFELYMVTGTAAGGLAITGTITNRTKGILANANARGDGEVTGLSDGSRVDLARTAANGRATMELNDVLILGQDDAIGIKYTGGTGIVDTIITGYFKHHSELDK